MPFGPRVLRPLKDRHAGQFGAVVADHRLGLTALAGIGLIALSTGILAAAFSDIFRN